MLTEYGAQMKGILYIAKLFGDEYIRQHRFSMCTALSYDYSETEANLFLGFEKDVSKNIWTEYAYVAVNKNSGEVRLLDFKLPSGKKMSNPSLPVQYA